MRNYAGDPLFLRRMYVDGGNLYVNNTISGVEARMATNDGAVADLAKPAHIGLI